MNDLISKLEAASEGSRELDAEIHRAVTPECADMRADTFPDGWLVGGDHLNPVRAPHYTTVFETARFLVPEGWVGMVEWSDEGAIASLERSDLDITSVAQGTLANGKAATLVLALVIAALRAQETDPTN